MAKEAEFMSIIVTARQRGAEEEYTSLTENNLSVTMIPDSGDTVFSITAEENFTGNPRHSGKKACLQHTGADVHVCSVRC